MLSVLIAKNKIKKHEGVRKLEVIDKFMVSIMMTVSRCISLNSSSLYTLNRHIFCMSIILNKVVEKDKIKI